MIPILEGLGPFARRSLRERSWVHLALFSVLTTVFVAALLLRHGQGNEEPLGETLALLDVLCLVAMALLGLLAAPAVAGAQMAQELRTGTVDQLRMTPLSAGTLALGVALGSPVPVYLLGCGPALLHLLLGVFGAVPLYAAVRALLILGMGSLAATLCFTALPLLVPRQKVSAGIVALPVGFLLFGNVLLGILAAVPDSAPWAYLLPGGALSALYFDEVPYWHQQMYHFHGRGEALHVLVGGLLPLGSLLASAVAAAFGALLCIRQLSDPDQPALTKKQAILGFFLVAVGLLGPQCLSFGITASVTASERADAGMRLGFSLIPVLLAFGAMSAPSRRFFTAYLRGQGDRSVLGLEKGAALHRSFLLMSVLLVALIAGLVLRRDGLFFLMDLSGTAIFYWIWLLLLSSTGIQLLRSVLQSPSARVLVLGLMAAAPIGIIACQDLLYHAGGAQVGVLCLLVVISLLPAAFYGYECHVRGRLRTAKA